MTHPLLDNAMDLIEDLWFLSEGNPTCDREKIKARMERFTEEWIAYKIQERATNATDPGT